MDFYSIHDMIRTIDEIKISFINNLNKIDKIYNWSELDARKTIFLTCIDLCEQLMLSLALLEHFKSNGLYDKKWWIDWKLISPEMLNDKIQNFNVYVQDRCQTFVGTILDQLFILSQIYIESFIRNLGRQFLIEENEFWKLKKHFLLKNLNLLEEDLVPLIVFAIHKKYFT